MTDDELQAALEASPGERVTEDYMTSRIAEVVYFRIGETMTICHVVLDNGFSVIGESACVDPANYKEDIGQMIAYDNAIRKLWQLFGFLLAEKRYLARQGVDGGRSSTP
jgi:hypothetical protein